MTLEEAVAQLECQLSPRVHGFESHPGHEAKLGPTGEPYVTMMPGGVNPEGQQASAICRSPEIAVQLWLDAAERYLADRMIKADGDLRLYWRIRPELNEVMLYAIFKYPPHPDITTELTWYTVYSRLLISDRPVKDAA